MTMASTGSPGKRRLGYWLQLPTNRRSLAVGAGARRWEQSSPSWQTNNSVNMALMYEPLEARVVIGRLLARCCRNLMTDRGSSDKLDHDSEGAIKYLL